MKLTSFIAAAFAGTLCSCSSLPENTVTIEQYKTWENAAPLKAREFRITARIEDEQGKVTPFRAVTAKVGKEEVTSAGTKEFIYPNEFDLPATVPVQEGQGDGNIHAFPVTPTTPTAFTMRPLGDELKITARPKGPFVEVRGSLSTTTTGDFDLYHQGTRSSAEAVSPISDAGKRYLITENLALQPEFKTTESLFYSAGLVTSEHRIALKDSKRTLVIKCEVVR